MSFTPTAIPAAPAIIPGADLQKSVLDAPKEIAERDAVTAEAKARKEMAPLAVTQAQQAAESAATKMDDERLAKIAPVLSQRPELANSPAMRAILEPIFKRRGIELPVGQDGALDPKALQGILNPQKPFSAWTQDDVNKALVALPGERVLPPDAPDWIKTAQVRTPMSQVGLNQVFTGLSAKEKLLTDAKSGYTPQQFLADVRQAQKRLQVAGNFGEADSLNEYFGTDAAGQPDPTKLNDAFVERHVGEAYGLEKKKLDLLGIKIQDEAKFKEERERDLRDQFNRTLKFKYSDLTRKQQEDHVKAQQAETRLNNSSIRLNGYLQSLELQKKRFQQSGQQSDFRVYKAMLEGSGRQLSDASKSLDAVTQQINNMSQNPKLRNSPLYQSLIDQAAGLKQFLDVQGPALRAQQYDASQQILRTYSGITGHDVRGGTPPQGGAPVAPEMWNYKGKKIVRSPDGQGFVDYATGQPVDTSQ